jgi:hypothetical protein
MKIRYVILSLALLFSSGCLDEAKKSSDELEKHKITDARVERESTARLEFEKHRFDAMVKLCEKALELRKAEKPGQTNCNIPGLR